MSDNLGTGVSRVMDPKNANFHQVIWQKGKPPLDSELNLIQALENDWRQQLVLRGTPSGWFGNETNLPEDFLTNANWSNWFQFGRQRSGEKKAFQWAVVNGWLVPITGTLTGTPPGSPNDVDTWNKITLDPPPTNVNEVRTDFVFLEVWLAKVAPNSATNKPSSSAVWKYGNVESGNSFLSDEQQDPDIGFETTQRVQVQYRIRVVKDVALSTNPDGFDATQVKAKGAYDATNATTVTSFTYENMHAKLGDPGLWRAGDGSANSLGTVDGYCYAIPIAHVFRRNSIAWNGEPAANLNGGFNRNPTALTRSNVMTFTAVPTLSSSINATVTSIAFSNGSGVVPLPSSGGTVKIGNELVSYTGITSTTLTGVVRGVNGTVAEAHVSGTTILIQSGRPDGLFADQVASTDILDARHIVSPRGFDHMTLLKSNLTKLLSGKLRTSWKSGSAGSEGPFVFYQDKIGSSVTSAEVTKIDPPDNIRTIWSDAAVQQKVECIVRPFSAAIVNPATQPLTSNPLSAFSLAISAISDSQGTGNQFNAGDTIIIPIAQFKNTLPAGATDQVRFINNSLTDAVQIRIDGQETPISSSLFTVTPTNPTSSSDLKITFTGSGIYPIDTKNVYITFNIQYGAGRGLSRRPDSLHGVAMISNTGNDYLLAPSGTPFSPNNNIPLSTGWAPLWGKYRSNTYKGMVPVVSESYADLGSKTVVVTPYRRVGLPTEIIVQDGSSLHTSAGLMPLTDTSNAAKWTTTDPLGLFSGTTQSSANLKNLYVTLPRHLVPGWGAYYIPVLPTDLGTSFSRGVNYLLMAKTGSSPTTASQHNPCYVSYANNGTVSYGVFSTRVLTTPSTATTYNTAYAFSGVNYAGTKFYTDTRGLGRTGLQLPPFYGIARLFAIYEAEDYVDNGSAFNSTSRDIGSGGAVNLLRQNFQGPVYWVEQDADGDATFIINSAALDLTKSPNAIANFASGHYVIEASLFGFDRGAFDINQPFRLVLSRTRPAGNADNATRSNNYGDGTNARIQGPTCVLPAPLQASDQVLINYSRTPYQGDIFGTQGSFTDTGYRAGPLTSADAYSVVSNPLDETNLLRANQKSLEVLASIGFATTLGTGRLSGDLVSTTSFDFRNVGYENTAYTGSTTTYPPTSGSGGAGTARPVTSVGALNANEGEVGTEYLGCTDRLPVGAFFRDKDFRGGRFQPIGNGIGNKSPLQFFDDFGVGSYVSGMNTSTKVEQTEVALSLASSANGTPGEVIVQVDGKVSPYTGTDTFRTLRGGSAFCGSGNYPGGEVHTSYGELYGPYEHTNVLTGRAYLVRNTVTVVGTEQSAGDELMMLIVTNVRQPTSSGVENFTLISTNGTQEGYAASDLYRIEGRPLVVDNTGYEVTPSSIALSKRVT